MIYVTSRKDKRAYRLGSKKMRRKPRIADLDTNTDFSVTYHYPLQRTPASLKAQNPDFISQRPFRLFFFLTEFSWHLHLGRSDEGAVGRTVKGY